MYVYIHIYREREIDIQYPLQVYFHIGYRILDIRAHIYMSRYFEKNIQLFVGFFDFRGLWPFRAMQKDPARQASINSKSVQT